MMSLLAQADPRLNFWATTPNSGEMWIKIIVGLLVSIGVIVGLLNAPTRLRKPVVWFFTFICGLFYVLLWIWPEPANRQQETDVARNTSEQIAFTLADIQPRVADITNIIVAILLGLGVYSLVKIHMARIVKRQADRGFSVVLLVSMMSITIFGYLDWAMRKWGDPEGKLVNIENWSWIQQGQNILFDGFLQQMDSAMFSIIAFFILSAAYRAFRIRSVESTVLMASALILMISLLSAVVVMWNGGVTNLAAGMHIPLADPSTGEAGFFNNFKISTIASWVTSQLQTPALRAVDFGIGLGALAMGLRLWLGLEKGGVSV